MRVARADEMRALDRAAMERGVPSRVLMENAGRAVAEAVAELAALLGGSPAIVVVAGKGNNGGDGLVVARLLHGRGYDVRVCLLADDAEVAGDAADVLAAARAFGVSIESCCDGAGVAALCADADIVVDAVLGTSIQGEVRSPAREAVEAINGSGAFIVAVDIPSGVASDTGAVAGVAVEADVTVTFGLPKVGCVVYPGAARCGELRVADIGIPPDALAAAQIPQGLITPELAAACLPARWNDMHKGDAGRLLVVAGSKGYTGAAALTAMGAVRAGAGLVYLAVPESVRPILQAKCTEPIVLGLPEGDSGALAEEAAEGIIEAAAEADAIALGPGLGCTRDTAAVVRRILAETEARLVLDADALNCLAATDADPLAKRTAPTVITPHPGELARLLGADVPSLQADRLGAARAAAGLFGCLVVLKGAGTVIAAPSGEAWISPAANHGLASGGTGDVLTGIIGGFLAGGASVEEAAIAGVYFHARAAELACRGRDPRSLAASDLLDTLGAAMLQPGGGAGIEDSRP